MPRAAFTGYTLHPPFSSTVFPYAMPQFTQSVLHALHYIHHVIYSVSLLSIPYSIAVLCVSFNMVFSLHSILHSFCSPLHFPSSLCTFSPRSMRRLYSILPLSCCNSHVISPFPPPLIHVLLPGFALHAPHCPAVSPLSQWLCFQIPAPGCSGCSLGGISVSTDCGSVALAKGSFN